MSFEGLLQLLFHQKLIACNCQLDPTESQADCRLLSQDDEPHVSTALCVENKDGVFDACRAVLVAHPLVRHFQLYTVTFP